MANPDKPIFQSGKGFDFEDPVLPGHAIEDIFSAPRPGVPEHWMHRKAAEDVRRPLAQRPNVEHHLQTTEPPPTA